MSDRLRSILLFIGLNAALALAYFVAARLGLATSIGPAQVTAVWPPSGLALAAFMLWGWRAVPGIALGSFSLNWLGYLGPVLQMRPEALWGAALLSMGSLLQAGLAAHWLRKVPWRLAASPTRQTLRFAAIVALCCVVAASIGNLALLRLGVVSGTELVFGWLTWWVGDCAGMLVVTPPLLLWLHPAIRRDPISSLAFPILCMGLGLTLITSFVVGYQEREASIERFRATARTLAMTLQNRVDIAQRDLEVLRSYYYKVNIDQAEFEAITEPMLARSPWQLNFGWLPRVQAAQREAFENASDGLAGMSIREIDDQDRLVRAAQRPQYLPMLWTAPATGHEALLGVDESADVRRASAIERVRASGSIAATPPLHSLARAATDRVVVTLYAPIGALQARSPELPTAAQQRGLVSAMIDLSALLRAAEATLDAEDLQLLLYDPAAQGVAGISRQGELMEPWSSTTQAKHRVGLTEGVHEELPIEVADRTWRLLAQPDWAGSMWRPSWLQAGVLCSGLAFTGLLTGFMVARRRRDLLMQGAKDELEAQVAARTHELAEANRSLGDEVAERRLLEGRLREASARAESASQAKSLFLANMSHEIRTPLNAVLGYAQLMMEDSPADTLARSRLATILDAGHRLLRLINDVLDLSKIEAGSLELKHDVFDLQAELQAALTLLAPRIQAKGLRLDVDLALPEARLVSGDRGKLGQIVINLLGNALKFTDQGFVALRAWRGGDSGDMVHIEVSDSGPGISAAEQAKLFAPFSQGQAGQDKGGTGLGLVVSRQIARAMGGDLLLQGEPGVGTRVRLSVRLVEQGAVLAIAAAPDLAVGIEGLDPATPCRVLVVEDDLHSRDVLAQALRRVGCQVSEAANGEEALQCCQAGEVDFVFTDIRMPVLDGLAMLSRLRADPGSAALPVVAVSASSLAHERSHYIAQGFQDFVAKPYVFADIYRMLSQHAGVRWRHREPSAAAPAATAAGLAVDSAALLDAAARATLQQLAEAAAAGELGRVQPLLTALGPAWLASPEGRGLVQAAKAYDFELLEARIGTLLKSSD